MPKILTPFEQQENYKKIKEIYEPFLVEITLDELNSKIANKEIDPDNALTGWVNDFMGDTPIEQAEQLYNYLVELNIFNVYNKEPKLIYDKIYVIEGVDKVKNIIATFKNNIFNMDNINENIISDYSVTEYFKTQNEIAEQEPLEEYDPLKFKEQQAEVDELEKQYENGEITLAELFVKFGWLSQEEADKIINIIEKLNNDELNNDDIKNMLSSGELNIQDISIIQNILQQRYPETYKKLNK